MSIIRAYQSPSGDAWDIVRNEAGVTLVRHTPNGASGGQKSEVAIDEFLRIAPHSAENQAVRACLEARDTPHVRGYVHDPKEEGGPYISVVLTADKEPIVKVHRSYAEAENELEKNFAALKQTNLSHHLRNG